MSYYGSCYRGLGYGCGGFGGLSWSCGSFWRPGWGWGGYRGGCCHPCYYGRYWSSGFY
ncbi:keratin-associated protein 19-7-like [Suricata suricatta]|uniref:Keratin associated protein 19-7 n=1 Tax=Suricata suricatta TaxID=37032 RepID=A0A673STT7_SURSU|nr:keratin-associated protein 19-7-like [Suricata suricatta]